MVGDDGDGTTLLGELEQLPSWSRTRRFGPDQPVFRHGEQSREFHFVVEGRVKLLKTGVNANARTSTMLDMVCPGRLLCGNAVYRGGTYCCNAVFDREGGTARIVPRERLLALVDERRGLWRSLMNEVTCRGVKLCERVDEVGRGTVEYRVARLLLRLWSEHGRARPGGGRWVPVALSRRDLAQLCGARIETVIRAMTRLERDGVVETTPEGFWILDHATLLGRANG